ncbi:MAG: polyketide synthase dehydratase domain-containing protein [Cyanobacteria bacterium SZAS TMP-1]|nr:polyketide synthase dehydratase domain-containing protein [Cyanobacteria bacterium SZAS TMP-1]
MNASKKVAIVGMSCLYPGAPDVQTFWSNIVRGVDASRDVSEKEWDAGIYYDPQSKTPGLSYSKRGGFISEYADFDPLKYGIMPSAVAGTDGDQFLTLRVAVDAMADAGYDPGVLTKAGGKPLDRDRCEIIIGRISAPGAGSMNLIHQTKTVHEIGAILRDVLPDQSEAEIEAVVKQVQARLVPSTADNIPGAMPNILAGRIAAKLGFRGRNLLIDAACASSMVAVETAVHDLLDKRCDFALAGGVHVNASNVFFQMFCGLGALSRKDNIRPFDQEADGTLLGEGVGILCLKRYEDAVADGDRIYATICGVASSSDGHGGSVLAPNLEGEALAMEKAYAMSGISPTTVELLEAHGTGTPVGDVVELEAVARVFSAGAEEKAPWCAVGSIKSMIGHCQSASAVAGIIKAALALHHKILPATLGVTKPNTKINWAKHPCYVNSQSRPWIHAKEGASPRRAAVSAFGFGGVNGHIILEEVAAAAQGDAAQESLLQQFDCELFTFFAPDKNELLGQISQLGQYVAALPNKEKLQLKDLAYSANCTGAGGTALNAGKEKGYRLALVATTIEDLLDKIERAAQLIQSDAAAVLSESDKGVYYTTPEGLIEGKLAFLYPGLGSAYTNMLADLCMHFPEVREVFEIVDSVALSAGASEPPSKSIFPAPFDRGERAVPTLLGSADFAVVAVLLAEYAIYQLLIHLGIKPDVIMGCSTGEFAAITTTGSVDVLSVAKTFYQLSTRVARSIPAESLANLRTLRVLSSWERVSKLAEGDLYLSADLGLDHIIVTGSVEVITTLGDRLKESRIGSHLLPVPIPYHTPLVASIIDANNEAVQAVDIQPLAIPGWSCSTALMYPQDVDAMRASFVELFTKPIALRQTVEAMYEDGVRTFVEVGPNGILTSSIAGILNRKSHVAVPSNLASRSGLTQIHHLLALLFVQGVPADLSLLYKRRKPQLLDWRSSAAGKVAPPTRQLSLTHTALKVDPNNIPTFSRISTAVEDFAPEEQSDDSVIESFLSTNASFYSKLNAISENIMRSYIQTDEGSVDVFSAGSPAISETVSIDALPQHFQRPFLRRSRITRLDSGATTEMILNLNLATDLYLLDHAIGGKVSAMAGTRVYLVPLMVTLEIMAEAALAQIMGGVPVRLENVRAYRRIVVDAQGLTLKAVAVQDFAASTDADGRERISVTLSDASDPATVYATADYLFDNDYHQELVAKTLELGAAAAPSRLVKPGDYYGDAPMTMFHGPSMQAVKAIELVGNRTISGQASAQPAARWMAGIDTSNFLIHPLLMDNASQFVLFYLYEKELSATALLPFLIESVDILRDPTELPATAKVTAVLPTLTERATEAALEVEVDGAVILKINGINSRRVLLSPLWEQFVLNPTVATLGTPVAVHNQIIDKGVIVQVEQSVLPDDDVILEWCVDYLLTRAEQTLWRDGGRTKKRKLDWLLGRIAAKEAVRKLVQNLIGQVLGPHDIEIINIDSGAPVVRFTSGVLPEILVSISHTQGLAVALATPAGAVKPGIDAEVIREREPSFARTFLKPHELSYLAGCPQDRVNAELTRFWSAKEALYKASGGIVEMSSFELATPSPGLEEIDMTGGSPAKTSRTYVSTTSDLVIAYTLAE